ncbi:MAG: hypothetical protein QM611_06580 [Microbacterium sp.]|uniref:hypothetical protein n=1 Tax=Microbacterium sp. TaxID=51671 RepID=UPI0039E38440
MSGPSSPRRRHSPAVYRRRRIVVLLALVVVAALVWLLIAQPWRGSAAAPTPTTTAKQSALSLPVPDDEEASPTPSSTKKATPTSTPTPDPSSTAATVAACKAADLSVEPIVDKDSYRANQKPKFSIALKNTGDTDCTLNVGTSTQKFVVTSGSDVWWRSTDCQSKSSDQVVLLAAGQRVESAKPVQWDRTRSSVKSCDDSDRARATGGGASYHLSVEIGGVESDETKQFLLY